MAVKYPSCNAFGTGSIVNRIETREELAAVRVLQGNINPFKIANSEKKKSCTPGKSLAGAPVDLTDVLRGYFESIKRKKDYLHHRS